MCSNFNIWEVLTSIGTVAAAIATAYAAYFAKQSASQSAKAAQDIQLLNKAKMKMSLIDTAAKFLSTAPGLLGAVKYLENTYMLLKREGWTKEDFVQIMIGARLAYGRENAEEECRRFVSEWE